MNSKRSTASTENPSTDGELVGGVLVPKAALDELRYAVAMETVGRCVLGAKDDAVMQRHWARVFRAKYGAAGEEAIDG